MHIELRIHFGRLTGTTFVKYFIKHGQPEPSASPKLKRADCISFMPLYSPLITKVKRSEAFTDEELALFQGNTKKVTN